MSLWRAYPDCPLAACERIERAVRALPPSYLKPPRSGEIFESAEVCLRRLQGFALSQGFAVVKASGSLASKRPRVQYKYVHHGKETRNTRQLENDVQRDDEENITMRRKRQNTLIMKKDCPWAVSLCKRMGEDEPEYLSLTVTTLEHYHRMAPNALQYKQYERLLEEYAKAARIAAFYRESFLPYSVSQRILAKEGLNLSRSDYYNLHRNKAAGDVRNEFDALLMRQALNMLTEWK
jgi:hypothetical protein